MFFSGQGILFCRAIKVAFFFYPQKSSKKIFPDSWTCWESAKIQTNIKIALTLHPFLRVYDKTYSRDK